MFSPGFLLLSQALVSEPGASSSEYNGALSSTINSCHPRII